MDHYLSICYQFRNEAPYLREWIEFHRLVGVEHFFLYDHCSTDDVHSVLDPYIDEGLVTLTDWSWEPHPTRSQRATHNHCIETFGATSRWIAFLDVDEFLFSPKTTSLPDALKPYEPYPAVFVNWQIYGSSGYARRPEGLVIENYTRRAPTDYFRNLKGKSIVDPRQATEYVSPHFFHYRGGRLAVTENFEPVSTRTVYRNNGALRLTKSSVDKVSVEHLRINHYILKSREDFMDKGKKTVKSTKYNDRFFNNHDRNEVVDPALHHYLPQLKEALSLAPGPAGAVRESRPVR